MSCSPASKRSCNCFLERSNGLPQLRIEGKGVRQFKHLLAYPAEHVRVFMVVESLRDPRAGLDHLWLSHSARGQCRGTDTDTAGPERRVGIKGNCILIDRHAGLSESVFRLAAQHAPGKNINQHQVGVRTAGNDTEAIFHQLAGEGPRVGNDLPGIFLE